MKNFKMLNLADCSNPHGSSEPYVIGFFEGGEKVALPTKPCDTPWSANKVDMFAGAVTRQQLIILSAEMQRELFQDGEIRFESGRTLKLIPCDLNPLAVQLSQIIRHMAEMTPEQARVFRRDIGEALDLGPHATKADKWLAPLLHNFGN